MLEALMKPFGELASVGEAVSQALWRAVRDVHAVRGSRDGADRRSGASRPRRRAAPSWRALVATRAEAQMLYDWAGGLIWLALDRRRRRRRRAGAPRGRRDAAAMRR